MKIHHLCANDGLNFEEFLENIADIDGTQNAGTFYISIFSEEAKQLINITEVSEGAQ